MCKKTYSYEYKISLINKTYAILHYDKCYRKRQKSITGIVGVIAALYTVVKEGFLEKVTFN